MEYKEIVAVTGIGGLFQLLATKNDGAIVRNLADQTTKFISARLHNVTPLESIEIYTTGENVRLHEVFEKMKEQEATLPPVDGKKADTPAIKDYFKTVFPELDEERVYISDMKKMLRWYEILKQNNLLDFSQYNEVVQTADATEEANAEEVEQPAKKVRAKKAAATTSDEATEAKPAKKAASRKKKAATEESEEEKPAKATAKKKKSEE